MYTPLANPSTFICSCTQHSLCSMSQPFNVSASGGDTKMPYSHRRWMGWVKGDCFMLLIYLCLHLQNIGELFCCFGRLLDSSSHCGISTFGLRCYACPTGGECSRGSAAVFIWGSSGSLVFRCGLNLGQAMYICVHTNSSSQVESRWIRITACASKGLSRGLIESIFFLLSRTATTPKPFFSPWLA